MFEFISKKDRTITEEFSGSKWIMNFAGRSFDMYSLDQLSDKETPVYYGGYAPEDVLASGKDILGIKLLRNGDPDFDEVKNMLPPIETEAYAFLGSAISWNGVIVDLATGAVCANQCADDRLPAPLFAPVMEDIEMSKIKPKMFLLDGKFPVMFSVHANDEKVLEFTYFVEAGDTNRDPVVWIRSKKYEKKAPEKYELTYRIASKSRPVQMRKIAEDTFITALCDTIAYWTEFDETGMKLELPEKLLEKVAHGTIMSCAHTFSGDHPHYGHKIYAEEFHDNFPPNYIWALEALCLAGKLDWAKRIVVHMLTYSLNDEGRFFYRQGEEEIFGASAEEYGQLLFIMNRYEEKLGLRDLGRKDWAKIVGMGNVILDNCLVCEEFGGRKLVKMCAEADTNTRIHVYLNNNFWAIRGLFALSELIERSIYKDEVDANLYRKEAEELLKNINELLPEISAKDTRFGNLPPFRFGYTATPQTLSICKDTFFEMTDEEKAKYFVPSFMRALGSNDQDLTENNYANYRYYPEILSAMYLPDEQAQAIVNLRESLGGEYMGLVRFMGHLDDWPILHYSRYLVEAENIEKYLMILYAHTCHHGHPELMCYYEQVLPGVCPKMYDCVPSLLTSPIMIMWMFAYEAVNDKKLSLLRAVPKEWFKKGFSVKDIGYSEGTVSISLDKNVLTIEFSKELSAEAEIVWRAKETLDEKDIIKGAEFISGVSGNRIFLKKGTRQAVIEIKA